MVRICSIGHDVSSERVVDVSNFDGTEHAVKIAGLHESRDCLEFVSIQFCWATDSASTQLTSWNGNLPKGGIPYQHKIALKISAQRRRILDTSL